ncbi:MAG: hypothetical protein ACI8RD_010311, partial [Bacillariaceae sp.]
CYFHFFFLYLYLFPPPPPFFSNTQCGFILIIFIIIFLFLSSFHKRSTRDFLLKTIRDDWGYPESEVVAEMSFDIPNSYKFHKSKTKDIEVDLIRICVVNRNDDNDAVGAVDVTVIDTIVEGSGCCDNDVNDGGNIEEDHHEIQNEEEGGTPKEI